MSEERVTIRRLAEVSGVSIGTVSRALNGYTDVNPETRERIMRLAHELDYTPAAAARSLKTQRSHVIGVFLETGEGHPDLQHPFFHEVLVGLKNAIGSGGYDLLLFAAESPGNGYGTHAYLKRSPPPQRRGRGPHGHRSRGPRGAPARALGAAHGGRRRRARGPGHHLRDQRQRRRRIPRCAALPQHRPPPHRHDHGHARDPHRAATACAATARRCRPAGSPIATSTSPTETSTWRAAAEPWPISSPSTSRPQRCSPRRT